MGKGRAENRIQEAWRYREEGKPLLSIGILTEVINEQIGNQEWQKTIDTAIDLHISWKNLGQDEDNPTYLTTALSFLNTIKEISDKNSLPLRNDWHYYMGGLQIDLELYQESITNYESYLNTEKLSPEQIANVNAHVGFAKVKLGNKEEGISLLKESIKILEKPTQEYIHQGKDVNVIWKTGAKGLLAMVLEDRDESKKLIQEVIDETKEKGLGARQKQAETLLNTFK